MAVGARASRFRAWSLLGLGAACLVEVSTLPWLLSSPALGLLLLGPPLLVGSIVCLLHGWALLGLRLHISDHGLQLTAPTWRGFPSPPLRPLDLAWADIKAVRRRPQRYHLGAAGASQGLTILTSQVYALDTSQGRVILERRNLPDLDEHMREICLRAGVGLTDCPGVDVSLAQALRGAEPDWPPLAI